MGWSEFVEFVAATGRALAELAALLLGVGFLIGAMLMTGLAGTLANDLVYLAGGAPLVLLVMGAITSFIFGLGLTVTACYIFLAIVLAPPLVKAGLDPLAIHMFVLYWGMVSFITPPVALAAFAAAPIAQTSQMRIGIQAMRLGTAIYVVPFCFVLNPALLLKGDAVDRRVQHCVRLCRHRARRPLLCRAMSSGSAGFHRTRPAGWSRALLLIGARLSGDPGRALPRPADAAGHRASVLPLPVPGLGLLYWINKRSGRTA